MAQRITQKRQGKDESDASRPYFNRKPGEIGIYIAIYDAISERPHDHGSEHFYHMQLLDLLHEHFESADIIKYRAALDKKGVFQGTYLERFEKGIVLAVGFDDVEALDAVWRLHNNKRLSSCIQDVLISSAILKTLGATKISLSTRLFEDEYKECSNELLGKKMEKLSLTSREKDLSIIKNLKIYQEKLSVDVQEIRDIENEMEHKLGAFVMNMKEILSKDIEVIKTFKEFETYVKVAKGTRVKKMEAVDFYITVLKKWRTYFAEIDSCISSPLLQVHSACENENQQKIKKNIRALCRDTLDKLRPEADLQKVIHPQWQLKVLQREKGLFCGLVCLVAVAADAALDISYMLDEYLNVFVVKA